MVCGTWTAVQARPSAETEAAKTFPRRESFNHFGTYVVPVDGPLLAVAPPVCVRRRNFSFPSVPITIATWRDPDASDSRNINPAMACVASEGRVSDVMDAIKSPSPVHD